MTTKDKEINPIIEEPGEIIEEGQLEEDSEMLSSASDEILDVFEREVLAQATGYTVAAAKEYATPETDNLKSSIDNTVDMKSILGNLDPSDPSLAKTDDDIVSQGVQNLDVSYKIYSFDMGKSGDIVKYERVLEESERDKHLLMLAIGKGIQKEKKPFIIIEDEERNFSQKFGNYNVFLKCKYVTLNMNNIQSEFKDIYDKMQD